MVTLLSVPFLASRCGRCARRAAQSTQLAEAKLSHFGYFQPPPVRSLTAAATSSARKRTQNALL